MGTRGIRVINGGAITALRDTEITKEARGIKATTACGTTGEVKAGMALVKAKGRATKTNTDSCQFITWVKAPHWVQFSFISCLDAMIRTTAKIVSLSAAGLLFTACSQPEKAVAPKAQDSEQQPVTSLAKPEGWDSDNFFLGRWQGNSTAGRAVVGVLSVEPNRVRWGNEANGLCDSDYSVEELPWGRNGRFPDQLVPPTKPTDLVYGVVRLTLQPRPCGTGVAVIQLAKPLDASNSLQVVTYDANGSMRGNYPDLTELPQKQVSQTHDFGGRPPIQDKATWPLDCTINGIVSTCRTEPAAKEGFKVYFSHADQPLFTFTPVGAPTTDRREMVDGSGQKWAMSGHRSFELEEIGGFGNRITVSKP